jgi:hypothetical protein
MRLVQFVSGDGVRRVGLVQDAAALRLVRNAARVYDLALAAHRYGMTLAQLVEQRLGDETVDYGSLVAQRRLLPPLTHADPAHCYVTGTGLTHLGSAKARDSMHVKAQKTEGASKIRE